MLLFKLETFQIFSHYPFHIFNGQDFCKYDYKCFSIIREKTKKINTENATIVGKSCNTKSVVQPTTLIVYLNKQAATTENVSCVKKPCFILPKPAPIHDLPLPTVAAMALSELADSEFVKQKVAVGVQTEDYGKCKEKRVSCGCKHNEIRKEANGHHSKSVRRINKRSMETQTSRSTVVKKRTRWALSDQGTQTDLITSRLQNLTSSTIATQTIPQVTNNDVEQPLDPPVMPNLYGTSNAPYLLDGSRDWYLADSVMSPLPFSTEHLAANSKICQTIKELDVDVNFNLSALVSSSTQTSPRTSVFSRGLNCPSPGHLLDGSLPGYLDMDTLPILQDYSMLSCSNNSYLPQDSESGVLKHCNLGNVEHLSSETQTDCNFSSLLLTDGGSCDSGEDDVGILSSNIQTQTSEDLESIPYDQLWSHTETQTSDPFLFSDLGGLCDIQTQTGYESCNPSVVDTHTQTCIQQTEGLTSQQINMETQTLLSLLEGHVSPFTDSHTQTSSIMGILEYCCAASELDTD